MVQKKVGRNGWAVMAALCMGVHVDRTFDMKPAARIAELTGLSEKQVARGMAELRQRGVIVPVTRRSKDGSRHVDRPCFGHVATYCFTKSAWDCIADGFGEPWACPDFDGGGHKRAHRGDDSALCGDYFVCDA